MTFTRVLLAACLAGATIAPIFAASPAPTAKASPDYGRLPLRFQPNVGQTDPRVQYLASGHDYSIFFTSQGATLSLRRDAKTTVGLQLSFVGADMSTPAAESPTSAIDNYYLGNDRSKWKTNVPSYSRLRYRSIYPGTDAIFYGKGRQLEYDLELAPHADPSRIALDIKGADEMAIDKSGDLIIITAERHVVFHRPLAYQSVGGTRREIASAFRIDGQHRVAFSVGAYDTSKPLVIDPTLVYSTYVGGSGYDGARAIAVDGSGNAYLAGYTNSGDYPVTAGVYSTPIASFYAVAVTKMNPSGNGVVYSTHFGGNSGGGDDIAYGIAVDNSGAAFITGFNGSSGFPTSPGAVRTSGGGAFVVKLDANGQLAYSTLVGGPSTQGNGIALDSSDNAYVVGSTGADLPTTANAFQKNYGGVPQDAFVLSLNSTGNAYNYVTYLGGGYGDVAYGVAVDGFGSAYVTGRAECNNFPSTPNAYQKYCNSSGEDIFVDKLSADGSTLQYGTFLHASGTGFGIALDANLNAYITGQAAPDMPTTPGAFQSGAAVGQNSNHPIAVKVNPSGTGLVYATYIGGNTNDPGGLGASIKVDSAGNAYITGSTYSSNYPVTPDAYQKTLQPAPTSTPNNSVKNALLTVVNPSGTGLVYSTYFGNSYLDGYGIALDNNNNIYIDGQTGGPGTIPTTAGAYQTTSPGGSDFFAAKFSAVSSSGGGGGGCLPSQAGATICQPSAGSSVGSSVQVQAGAVAAGGYITAIRIYVDNASIDTVYNPQQTTSFQINTSENIAAGYHHLVVVAYQSDGGAQVAGEYFTVGSGNANCVPSNPGSAVICSPGAGATVTSPVDISAGAAVSTGGGYITAIRVYIDDVAAATYNDPQQNASWSINQSLNISSGTHHLVIVGYQSNGAAQVAGEYITVQ